MHWTHEYKMGMVLVQIVEMFIYWQFEFVRWKCIYQYNLSYKTGP